MNRRRSPAATDASFSIEHPALVYWLGFERVPDPCAPHGFDVAQIVPKRRHFSTVLRSLPNPSLQFLLDASVQLLRATLCPARIGYIQRWRIRR